MSEDILKAIRDIARTIKAVRRGYDGVRDLIVNAINEHVMNEIRRALDESEVKRDVDEIKRALEELRRALRE